MPHTTDEPVAGGDGRPEPLVEPTRDDAHAHRALLIEEVEEPDGSLDESCGATDDCVEGVVEPDAVGHRRGGLLERFQLTSQTLHFGAQTHLTRWSSRRDSGHLLLIGAEPRVLDRPGSRYATDRAIHDHRRAHSLSGDSQQPLSG